jgi:pyruvate dehydrogenase E2 component (dihydrolipoamide acetyltransferase)
MSSVLNLSGLNYQRGNPLGREVRSLQADVAELKKQLAALKAGGVGSTPTVVQGPPGPAGPAGPPGPPGPAGPAGPMAYIAMPPQYAAAPAPVAVAPVAPAPAPVAPAPVVRAEVAAESLTNYD